MSSRGLSPPPINSPLRGYLDFFGIKNGGVNPQTVAPDIAPVMDLQRWYMEGQADVFTFSRPAVIAASASANLVAINATTPVDITTGGQLVVPETETWLLLPGSRAFAGFSAHAGSQIDIAFVARAGATDQFEWLPLNQRDGFVSSSAAIIQAQARTLSYPVWLRPGVTLSVWHYGATVGAGGSIDIAGTLKLVRLLS